ncbi:MAG: hypothetical protein AAGA32_15410 [Pseudomonadota bacterium]
MALAGVAGGPTAAAVRERADIAEMIAVAERAALRPDDPGGLSHTLRAEIAASIAKAEGCTALAERWGHGSGEGAPALRAFADKVAMGPRDIVSGDIDALRAAGVAEPDIVRLCELVAFTAFYIRVVKGLAAIGREA